MRVWWGDQEGITWAVGWPGCKGFTRRLVVVLEFGEGEGGHGEQVPSGGQVIGRRSAELYSNGPPSREV